MRACVQGERVLSRDTYSRRTYRTPLSRSGTKANAFAGFGVARAIRAPASWTPQFRDYRGVETETTAYVRACVTCSHSRANASEIMLFGRAWKLLMEERKCTWRPDATPRLHPPRNRSATLQRRGIYPRLFILDPSAAHYFRHSIFLASILDNCSERKVGNIKVIKKSHKRK